MHIVVLIKQVPEMDRVRFDTEKGVIDRKSAGVEVNPFDLNALEIGVQIKEQTGGKVTALSMGPPRAHETLRQALARGADEGILLTDRAFAGADTWATSLTLAQAIKTIGEYDLIIAGEMTVDGDTAQVGPQTAEHLGIPHVAYVSSLECVEKGAIVVRSQSFQSYYRKRLYFPGLITVTRDIAQPRLPTLKKKLWSRKASISTWGLKDLLGDLEPEMVGLKGSPTQVKKIVIPKPMKRESRRWSEDNLTEALEEIKDVLLQRNRRDDDHDT